MAGDQRHIIVQTTRTKNKRKLRRASKERKKAKHPQKDRVFHILATSKLLDYTHPSEVDVYWDKLYREYEMLVYLEAYYRFALAKYDKPLTDKEIADIQKDLLLFAKLKKLLLRYMLNAFYIQYGSVMSKKFYGWLKHMKRFTTRFTDEALKTIKTLKFDVDRTRCSVYFYQIFWLTGLVVKNEIMQEVQNIEFNESVGFSDRYYSSETISYNPRLYKMANPMDDDITSSKIFQDEEDDKERRIREFMKNILEQLGLGLGVVDNLNNAGFLALTSHIRKAIKEGRIQLTKDQIELLKEVGIKFAPSFRRKFLKKK